MDIEIRGGDQLERLADRLYRTGNVGLEKELQKGLVRGARPLPKAVKTEVPTYMPKRGGYAATLAKDLRFRTEATGRAGVRITARGASRRKGRHVADLNRGTLRHPVYGRYSTWVDQKVPPGFFTGPITRKAVAVRDELLKVVQAIADKITGG